MCRADRQGSASPVTFNYPSSDWPGMEYVQLGRSGPRISAIGIGTWQAGDDTWGIDVNDADCVAAIRQAIRRGINLIDTAENYGQGHSEEVVGEAIGVLQRDEVFVATKVSDHHLRGQDVQEACSHSLRRLKTPFIDLYQVHWPDPYDQVPLKETMKSMERLQREGKIGEIGVSNFAVRDLEEARSHLSRADIVSNQVQYNLLHRNIECEVLPYCQREGITVLAYSPLGRGVLTGKYHASLRPSDAVRSEDVLFRPNNLRRAAPLIEAIKRIADSHQKTPAQVALAWLSNVASVVPIPGAKRPAQSEENAGAVGWSLSRTQCQTLDRLSRDLNLDTF